MAERELPERVQGDFLSPQDRPLLQDGEQQRGAGTESGQGADDGSLQKVQGLPRGRRRRH